MLDKLRRYGLYGFIRLLRDVIFSKLIFPGSRIIRLPYYIRGWAEIKFGERLTTGVGLRIDAIKNDKTGYKIIFGNDVQLNDYVHIAAINSITIGDNVLIASKVFITDHNHGSYSGANQSDPLTTPIKRELYGSEVIIEKNVWIGEAVAIMPGVTIGEGSIIGASSVVSKSIPPYSIAVGSPAKVIKQFNFDLKEWTSVK